MLIIQPRYLYYYREFTKQLRLVKPRPWNLVGSVISYRYHKVCTANLKLG